MNATPAVATGRRLPTGHAPACAQTPLRRLIADLRDDPRASVRTDAPVPAQSMAHPGHTFSVDMAAMLLQLPPAGIPDTDG